ncbi:forkhead box protein B2-like [Hetaerina americana]|uniref:forkhead box protein B2-like n=1 Tax=Hetaerina americana TaxID=62018 RepID=UPI003A7F1E10
MFAWEIREALLSQRVVPDPSALPSVSSVNRILRHGVFGHIPTVDAGDNVTGPPGGALGSGDGGGMAPEGGPRPVGTPGMSYGGSMVGRGGLQGDHESGGSDSAAADYPHGRYDGGTLLPDAASPESGTRLPYHSQEHDLKKHPEAGHYGSHAGGEVPMSAPGGGNPPGALAFASTHLSHQQQQHHHHATSAHHHHPSPPPPPPPPAPPRLLYPHPFHFPQLQAASPYAGVRFPLNTLLAASPHPPPTSWGVPQQGMRSAAAMFLLGHGAAAAAAAAAAAGRPSSSSGASGEDEGGPEGGLGVGGGSDRGEEELLKTDHRRKRRPEVPYPVQGLAPVQGCGCSYTATLSSSSAFGVPSSFAHSSSPAAMNPSSPSPITQ